MKKKTRFSVGDKCMLLGDWRHWGYCLNTEYEIIGLVDGGYVVSGARGTYSFYENELLEPCVYNSKLYKTLNDDR